MNRTINTALLGTWQGTIQTEMVWILSFNGWRLDNWTTIRVTSTNHDDIGTIDFNTYNTPLEDWGGVLGKYYRKKTIDIGLSVQSETQQGLNDLIDEIKYRTSFTEWILRYSINGITRERTATCTSLKFNRQYYNINWLWSVALSFTCVNPHSRIEVPSTESFIMQSWTYSAWVLYDGRAESYPTLLLTIDSGESEGLSFTLNGYKIQISSSLSAWDVVVFDGEKKSVTVNGEEVEYTGAFTPLAYGENTISISSEATYTWTLSFYKNFL